MVEIVENFLSAQECRTLIENGANLDFSEATVGHGRLNHRYRSVKESQLLGETWAGVRQRIVSKIEQLYRIGLPAEQVEPYMRLLRYEVDDHYVSHNDSHLISFDGKEWRAKEMFRRDVSVVLYLNDDFDGGQIQFIHLDKTIQPKAGMLLLFPSGYQYEHRVFPVTKGVRYAVVSWLVSNPRIVEENELITDPIMISYYRTLNTAQVEQDQEDAQIAETAALRTALLARFKARG